VRTVCIDSTSDWVTDCVVNARNLTRRRRLAVRTRRYREVTPPRAADLPPSMPFPTVVPA